MTCARIVELRIDVVIFPLSSDREDWPPRPIHLDGTYMVHVLPTRLRVDQAAAPASRQIALGALEQLRSVWRGEHPEVAPAARHCPWPSRWIASDPDPAGIVEARDITRAVGCVRVVAVVELPSEGGVREEVLARVDAPLTTWGSLAFAPQVERAWLACLRLAVER